MVLDIASIVRKKTNNNICKLQIKNDFFSLNYLSKKINFGLYHNLLCFFKHLPKKKEI